MVNVNAAGYDADSIPRTFEGACLGRNSGAPLQKDYLKTMQSVLMCVSYNVLPYLVVERVKKKKVKGNTSIEGTHKRYELPETCPDWY